MFPLWPWTDTHTLNIIYLDPVTTNAPQEKYWQRSCHLLRFDNISQKAIQWVHYNCLSVSKTYHGTLVSSIDHIIPNVSIGNNYLLHFYATCVYFSKKTLFEQKPASLCFFCPLDSINWIVDSYWRKSAFYNIQKQFQLQQPTFVWTLLIIVQTMAKVEESL